MNISGTRQEKVEIQTAWRPGATVEIAGAVVTEGDMDCRYGVVVHETMVDGLELLEIEFLEAA